jgi:crossover junction endodeoxyribonuclease RuvC
MAKVLALDISSKTGFACDGHIEGRPVSGVIRLPKASGDDESGWNLGPLFADYRRQLASLLIVVQPDICAFEAPLQLMHGGHAAVRTSQNTVRLLFGLAGITEGLLSEKNVRGYEANLATVKKHFAGSGRAEKEAMVARCRQLGWPAEDHNAADACGLWSLMKSLHDPRWSPRSTPLFGRTA